MPTTLSSATVDVSADTYVNPSAASATAGDSSVLMAGDEGLDAANAPVAGAVLGRAAVAVPGAATVISIPASAVPAGAVVSFVLTSITGDPSAVEFASSESADPTEQPHLVISYTSRAGGCTTSALLVPSCGAYFGSTVNPVGTETGPLDALARQESELGRTLGVVHTYHKGAQDWPTPDEVAMVSDPARPRLLMVNWKPEDGATWAQVAGGSSDALIDGTAGRIVSWLGGRPFFLSIHHEPENDLGVDGSGDTPTDYVAMYRHVVQRLRVDGVSNAVMVWDMMGFSGWGDQGLYPGDDVVDWIGYDPYSHRGMPLTTFANDPGRSFPGFYTWATQTHPEKPLMLAEFGVDAPTPTDRSGVFDSFAADAAQLPAIKAYLYSDHDNDAVTGTNDYFFDDDPTVLASARAAFEDPYFLP